MDRNTFFADVILPLAIPRPYTYRVPGVLANSVKIGQRVIVQLGKTRLYTGIIQKIHQEAPQNYEAKYLETILDDEPIVNSHQLNLWEWMASYYCCGLGEVMTAALPASLKLSSETKLLLRDPLFNDADRLSEKEWELIQVLKQKKALSLSEASVLLKIKSVQALVNALLKKDIIVVEEELKDKYQAKTIEYLRIDEGIRSEDRFKEALNGLSNAPKQLEALMAYLDWCKGKFTDGRWMPKKELCEKAKVSSSIVQSLVQKGYFELQLFEVDRIPGSETSGGIIHPLSEAQAQAKSEIEQWFQNKDIVLLHGVTSAGKTEIYNELIAETIQKGKQVLYLLPEIALSTQLIRRLQKRFGDAVGVYHSKFNPQERAEIWHRLIENQRYKILLGARSTLFLPFNNLGLIIIDEEHEPSFKQSDPAPRYHARDCALILAKNHGAKVLLGSATPSVETYWHAQNGHYGLVQLKVRYNNQALPMIRCADMRDERKNKRSNGNFSSLLIQQMRDCLEKGKQVILFQNRRGYSPRWQCEVCAWTPMCTQCDISLTYHKNKHQLSCHYCGYAISPPSLCASCSSSAIKMIGFGTEKLEDELALLLPNARIQRLDHDSTKSKNAYSQIIRDFEKGEIDVLIGTQMVSKGLDFANVALVGVMDADQMLHQADFRANERSFHLMSQVSGRSGRSGDRGQVIVQASNVNHWVIEQVIRHDYEGLYKQEIIDRQEFHYPPFYRLINLNIKNPDKSELERHAIDLAILLRASLGELVLGPEFPAVEKLRNWYQMNIMVKFSREFSASKIKQEIVKAITQFYGLGAHKKTRVNVNVDPV